MSTRAARYTIEKGKVEHYSDFLTNFDKNPLTGYLARAVDRQAIEISLRNLILTNRGDYPFESSLGSKVRASLFDLGSDPRDLNHIEETIAETIRLYEPRIKLDRVALGFSETDQNRLYVSIYYIILNVPDETFQFDVAINRVR